MRTLSPFFTVKRSATFLPSSSTTWIHKAPSLFAQGLIALPAGDHHLVAGPAADDARYLLVEINGQECRIR